jgi:hypothetical protein
MKNELNYLSEKILKLEVDLSYLDMANESGCTRDTTKLTEEIELLENILNALTINDEQHHLEQIRLLRESGLNG